MTLPVVQALSPSPWAFGAQELDGLEAYYRANGFVRRKGLRQERGSMTPGPMSAVTAKALPLTN
jgi:hypothetical protein